MTAWPRDCPRERVLRTFRALGFEVVRFGNHTSLRDADSEGVPTTLTLPNHRVIKGATLRFACTLARIDRGAFLAAYARS